MKIDKDNLLGLLGAVLIIGSIVVVFLGIKFTGREDSPKTDAGISSKEEAPKLVPSEEATSSAQEDKEEKEDELEKHSISAFDDSTSSPPASGSTVVLGPSEPAEAPGEDEIVKVRMLASSCEPPSSDFSKKDSIVLELRAEDGDYKFAIEESPIEEEIKKGETRRITFSGKVIDEERMLFECIKINNDR